MPTYIAIIPAKGTSRRIPGKNIRDFVGKPILAYTIETARKVGIFDHICVSTEDQGVIEVAKRYGAEIVKRPLAMAECRGEPDPGTHEVARHAVETYCKGGLEVEMACCIYPCAPLMTAQDIWQGWEAMQRPGAWWSYGVGPDGADSGTFYWGWAVSYLDRLPMPMDEHSDHVWKVPIAPERCCDINTEEDWQRSEQLYKALKEGEQHGKGN